MSKQQHPIDELFRQGVEAHRKAPSPQAWQKLEGQLAGQRKKRTPIYLAIAAAVSLLLVAWWQLKSPVQNNPGMPTVAQQAAPAPKETQQPISTTQQPTVAQTTTPANQPTHTATTQNNTQDTYTPKAVPQALPTLNQEQPKASNQVVAQNNRQKPALLPLSPLPNNRQVVALQTTPVNLDLAIEAPALQIVPNLDAKLETMDQKQEALAANEAPQEKKSFSLRKVVNQVKEFTETEFGLYELRQAKSALMDFNSKSERSNQP